MFNTLMNKRAALMAKFADVKENDIQDAELRSKFRKLKAKQGGFTLLELLVVVAILAAIAGTASLALQDTDARASAAAHVAMMDELNKGIRSYRVLNKNELPNRFDSLLETDGSTVQLLQDVLAIEDVAVATLPATIANSETGGDSENGILAGGGINTLRIVNTTLDPEGEGNCADVQALIASRGNAVVAGNIYLGADANGCGADYVLGTTAANLSAAVWTGGTERLIGVDRGSVSADGAATASGIYGSVDDTPVYLAVGLGPASSLFNAEQLGGMTTVPVYRHVSETEYNRFVALFNIGTVDTSATDATGAISPADQVVLTAIVDGAGDTKEEELGEWDGTRNTI